VEFENGSTARLGESSHLSFDQLAMDADGNKLNRLRFTQGYGTFHFFPERLDVYSVKVAATTLTPDGKCEFRTDLGQDRLRVEVFIGTVQVSRGETTTKLGKDKVVEFDPGAVELAWNEKSGIDKDAWDKWNSDRDAQEQLSRRNQPVDPRGPLYGWSDLNAYGEWAYYPGFGYGWSPFAMDGWSPFSMGMWSWYSGMGYTWISSEPWGWLPYHYGNWLFDANMGWFWMPSMYWGWSPGLVSWYQGPGWIGWMPAGRMPHRVLNTVPTSVLQNGQAIGSHNLGHAPVTEGTLLNRLPVEPGTGARLPGAPLAGAAGMFSPRPGVAHAAAPSSILMGGNPQAEQAALKGHFGHEPLRLRTGSTLGGKVGVGGTAGVFRGDAFKGSGRATAPNGTSGREISRGGPVIVSHGQQGGGVPHGGGGGSMSSSSGHSSGGSMSSGHVSGGGSSSSSSSMSVGGSSGGGHSAGPSGGGGGGHH